MPWVAASRQLGEWVEAHVRLAPEVQDQSEKALIDDLDAWMGFAGTISLKVRVIDYRLDGAADAEPIYRLMTNIVDHKQASATELAALYHERWEIETAFGELKTHLRGAKIVLRSKTPDLVRQEFYGLLMAHFAIRGLIHEAALKADEDPDRLSFLHAVRVVRRKLPAFTAIPPHDSGQPCMTPCSTKFSKSVSSQAVADGYLAASNAR